MLDDPKYVAQWAWYRRWKRVVWIMFFLWLPYGAAAGAFCSYMFGDENIGMWFALPYMVALVVVGNIAVSMRCPRCGRMFFRDWWYTNSFARKCTKCGLKKYANHDPDHTAQISN